MRQLRPREGKRFAQGHRARQGHGRESNSGGRGLSPGTDSLYDPASLACWLPLALPSMISISTNTAQGPSKAGSLPWGLIRFFQLRPARAPENGLQLPLNARLLSLQAFAGGFLYLNHLPPSLHWTSSLSGTSQEQDTSSGKPSGIYPYRTLKLPLVSPNFVTWLLWP